MAAEVLHSSPASVRRSRHDAVLIDESSSPEWTPLSDLLRSASKKGPIRSGSPAVPIPDEAPKAFTNPTSIWRSTQLSQSATQAAGKSPPRFLKPTPKSKPKPKEDITVIELSSDTSETSSTPKRGGGVACNVTDISRATTSPISSSLDAKPWKKFKSPLRCGQGRPATTPEIVPGRARDTGIEDDSDDPFSDYDGSRRKPQDENEASREVLRPLPRKVDWTPPGKAAPPNPVGHSSDMQEVFSSDDDAVGEISRKDLVENLQSYFGCKEVPSGSEKTAGAEPLALKKRKLLEMVSINSNAVGARSASTSPTKPKAPPKKARTITELATAPYAAAATGDGNVENANSSKLAPHRLPADTAGASEADPKAAEAPKSKGSRKPKAPKQKPAVDPRKVLLAPSEALVQASNQDFIFGTSSQLAAEQSPRFLKELHAAMQASNECDDLSPSSPQYPPNPRQRQRLWKAAARNEDGDLVEAEIIDLVDSPTDPFASLASHPCAQMTQPRLPDVIALSSSPSLPPPSTKAPAFNVSLDSPYFEIEKHTRDEALRVVEALEAAAAKDARGGGDASTTGTTSATAPGAESVADIPRPKYELYSNDQLARELASYGFKPIKKRDIMIATLDQCWRSNNARKTGSLSQAAPYSTAATAPAVDEEPVRKPGEVVVVQMATKRRGKVKSKIVGSTEASQASKSQKPDPEAQPVKRPRGRPRKDTTANATGDAGAGAPPPPATAMAAAPKRRTRAPAKSKSATQPLPPPPLLQPTPPTKESVMDVDSDDGDYAALSPDPDDPETADVTIDDTTELDDGAGGSGNGPLRPPPTATIAPATRTGGRPKDLSPEDEAVLFAAITRAVTSAPRSRASVSRQSGSRSGCDTGTAPEPSWHEKMLMYDPIILEDFAAWLNSGPLTREGWDDEVWPGLVKRWCESRSVCCLWRVSLRGKERKRM